MNLNLIFHPLNFKKPQKIYFDKRVEVFSFPVKHSIPTCGFLFREIQKPANIKKELIKQYDIPIKKIKEIKRGPILLRRKEKLFRSIILQFHLPNQDHMHFAPILHIIRRLPN